MTLRLNGTEIKNLRLNGVQIDKAYLNGVEVFKSGPSAIGEFYEGGYYFGMFNGYYLICAPILGQTSTKRWQEEYTNTPGASSLNDGYTNTLYMSTALHPAGKFCFDLNLNGYTDWYLPAINELALLRANYLELESAGAGDFIKLSGGNFWSSSQVDAIYAWQLDFRDGQKMDMYKKGYVNARAIRRVAV